MKQMVNGSSSGRKYQKLDINIILTPHPRKEHKDTKTQRKKTWRLSGLAFFAFEINS